MGRSFLLVIVLILNVKTIWAESSFYKLNGGRGEAVVADPYEELEIESVYFDKNIGKDIITYVDGSSMERPNRIIYSDNSVEFVDYSHKLLYINGALVKNTEVEIINNKSYVDVSIFDNIVDCSVEINSGVAVVSKGENSVLIKDVRDINGNTYIPLREVFEGLKMNVEYYAVTDRKSVSLIPTRVSIYIDEIYTDYIGVDEAIANSKKICLEGLGNQRKWIAESYNGEVNLDDEFLMIEECINEMSYIGEVSRYYVFDMNLYRVVYDKVSGEVYFDYNTGLSTFVKIVDVNDSGLYNPLFIVG